MTIRQRQPRVHDAAFLAFVRRHPCCVCHVSPPSQAAHVRMACEERGKRGSGFGEKPDDRWTVPLCADCHLNGPNSQHSVGEARFWSNHVVDPFDVAERIYADFQKQRRLESNRQKPKSKARKRGPSRKISSRVNQWPKGRKLQWRKP